MKKKRKIMKVVENNAVVNDPSSVEHQNISKDWCHFGCRTRKGSWLSEQARPFSLSH